MTQTFQIFSEFIILFVASAAIFFEYRRSAAKEEAKLAAIMQKTLQRDREQRYQSASALLTDLELYLYSDRYGPTNEKLAVYLAEIFPVAEFGATPAVPHSFRPATLAQL